MHSALCRHLTPKWCAQGMGSSSGAETQLGFALAPGAGTQHSCRAVSEPRLGTHGDRFFTPHLTSCEVPVFVLLIGTV